MRLRAPRAEDGAPIWRLVNAAGALEPNSAYAYVLFSTHFASTCVVADDGDSLAGAVVAYRPPTRPESLFVWQIAVAPEARGAGLGRRMLCELAERTAVEGVKFVEATVTPDNEPSRRLFAGFARTLGAPCVVSEGMPAALFPEPHEPERLHRIGPFTTEQTRSALAAAAAPLAAEHRPAIARERAS